MSLSLRHAAGSLLVVGLAATELSGLERAWLKVVRPSGVILFRRNIADVQQTQALLNETTALCADHAFRCVDVEGGTVDRLRDALAPMPSAQAVASAERLRSGTSRLPTLATEKSRKDGARKSLAHEHGELIALGVKAFGFNVTLAPVLDLALPDSAVVMGSRAAGSTPDEVVAFARAFLAGLAAQGVAGCGKHFPGLGGGARDSHLETPQIHRTLHELEREDLAPYRELRNELPMVMVNHAAYPGTPSKDLPATASKFWITTVLRKRLGYRGLIFSDDMEMGGILKFMPMEEAAVTAIRAGMDTLEICHSPELILRAYEALIAEAERSSAFRALLLARAHEAEHKRAQLFAADATKALTPKQFETLRTRILRFREKVLALTGEVQTATNKPATLVETA
jgi:beta-N-acetylhexosaminidase